MKAKILQTAPTPPMPTSDTEMLLDSFKIFKVVKSLFVLCGLCSHAASHTMRVRLPTCKCPTCAAVVPFTL
ncbi:hypothetical protein PHYSODRAFT_483708 [Phytophthora sojae]|uniref:Uncharacterized protein n=1 Tax=Phytophthora sojae (strain P6497) TaxID=1094619 RepID=G4YU41_PHYSP|nr:hypothetical protein PHYSODRAFT_483708 [Phytophthora sojae]EGZ23119.1 hypothetical protein PHYSODRAFT_483708 [Phytophthora sojae]|eukprot:XP_009518407.1 hypothetical protein PHYSODRAFT_483708 [Phytophthora sojae]